MIPKRPKRNPKLKRLGPKVRIPPELYEELIQVHGEVAFNGSVTDFVMYLLAAASVEARRQIQSTKLVQPASPQLAAKLRHKDGLS